MSSSNSHVACAMVEAGSWRGTGYLVGPRTVVTSGHVVQHLSKKEDGTRVLEQSAEPLTVRFKTREIPATIEFLDSQADVAVLKLESAPEGVAPLEFADPAEVVGMIPCRAGFSRSEHVGADALLVSTNATNRFDLARMTLRAPKIADQLMVKAHALAGAPVLVAGRVAGHIVGAVRSPESLGQHFAGLVEAVPLEPILALLPEAVVGHAPRGDFVGPSPAAMQQSPPPIKPKEYHAFVSYRAVESGRKNDQDWVNALLDRLAARGFRAYPAPHLVFGDSDFEPRYGKPLARSQVALIVFSERCLDPPFDEEVAPILARLEADQSFRAIVLRLDDTPVPENLRAVKEHLTLGDQRATHDEDLPNGDAVLTVLRALVVKPEQAAGGSHDLIQLSPSSAPHGSDPDSDPGVAIAQAADDVMGALKKSGKNPELVRALALRWIDSGMPGSDVPVEAARILVGREHFDFALEVLDRAEAQAVAGGSTRNTSRLTRMRGAALGEAGQHDEAIKVLEGLRGKGPLDEWAAGILGSNYKQKWVKLGKTRRALLRRAYDVYAEAFSRTLSYYAGINAATLARQLGREEEARAIATLIRDRLDQPGVDYIWELASLGEANLLLGEYERALEFYEQAALQAEGNPGMTVSIREQFPLLLPETSEEVQATRKTLDALFELGRSAAFSGYRIDQPGDNTQRFPERRERLVRRRIKDALDLHDVSWGVCSAADGSDITFAECVLARGGEVEILLPYPRAAFRARRVAPKWRDRFDSLMSEATVVELSHQEPGEEDLVPLLLHCMDRVLDRAIRHASVRGEAPVMISVRNPDDGDSLSAFVLAAALDEGLAAEEISVSLDAPKHHPGSLHGPARGLTTESGESRSGLMRVKLGADSPVADSAARPESSGDYNTRHLVVIGIDRYESYMPRLINAKNDARGVAKVLVDSYGFKISAALYDEEATRDNIAAAIQEGLKDGSGSSGKVEEDDLVVIFFAGHGETERIPSGDNIGYLVPVEAPPESGRSAMITMSQVRDWTKLLPCRHLLIIFDSCFSGSALSGDTGSGDYSGWGRWVITAGAADQKVADGSAESEYPNNSVFTGRLLSVLEKGPVHIGLPSPLSVFFLAGYLVNQVSTLR